MHKNGVCHRDLKPHNIILIEESMTIKITDFNVSKFFSRTLDGTDAKGKKMGTHTGTLAFCAPESLNKQEYT